jgi:hypothetical protein
MLTALDEGRPAEEAHHALHGHDLTGLMAGAAIAAVRHSGSSGEQ